MKNLLIIICFFFFACTGSKEHKDEEFDPEFENEIRPLTNAYCRECHKDSSFLKSGSAFKSSKAGTYLKNRYMPQKGSEAAKNLSDKDRQTMIDYANSESSTIPPSDDPY